MSEFGEVVDATDGASEMGATVQPPSRYVYRYYCPSCETRGSDRDDEASAQSDGLEHEQRSHPRVYKVEKVGMA